MSEERNRAEASGAQPPEELSPATVKSVSNVAGGVPAVLSAAKYAFKEMGVLRASRTMLELNQKQGIGCPGCAWPVPDEGRSHFEFCEEGAKHVADEATTKRVTAKFFRQWSVADLAQRSDLWL